MGKEAVVRWWWTHFMISAKPIASSTPGIANARSCIIEPIMPFWSARVTGLLSVTVSNLKAVYQRTLLDHFL